MNIGVIGAGNLGHALAVRFAEAGHEVMVSNSRGPDTLVDVVASVGGSVRAGAVEDAARFGEIVAIAIPPRGLPGLPPEPFAGKIVADANNYYPENDGPVPEFDDSEAPTAEVLAALLPGARVVKVFNTLYFRRLLDDSRPDLPPEQRLAVPVAGDDADATRIVIDLIGQIGFAGVDAGTLAESRRQQPGTPLYAAYAEARQAGSMLTESRLRELLAAS